MQQFCYTYSRPNKNINLQQYVYKIGSYHYNWHKDLELLLVINGEIEVCANGVSSILETDDTILINSNVGHATLARKPDSIAMVLHIDPIIFKEYYDNTELLHFDLHSTKKTRNEMPFLLIRAYLSEMMLSYFDENPEQKLLFESSFYSLLHTIVSHFPPKVIHSATFMRDQKIFKAIDKMIQYINKNYKKKITLEKLGKKLGYHPNYVSQLFKTYMGINFCDYLTRIRLREATIELSHSEKTVSEIALSNGFSDVKAFNIAFKRNFGKTPTSYRKQLDSVNKEDDINFKKIFVSREDEAVNKKLQQYISDKNSVSISGNYLSNHEKIILSIELMKKMSYKLKGLIQELVQTTDCLEKIMEDVFNK